MLEQLINRDLAYQGASDLDAQFIGTKGQVAQEALAFVSRDASASDEELQTYYDANTDSFTVPASAVVTRVDFSSEAAASSFRDALLNGTAVQDAADAASGTVQDLGTVRRGALQPELDSALFDTEAFTALPNSPEAVSDVLVLSEPVEPDPSGAGTGGAETGGADTGGSTTGGVETGGAGTGGADTGKVVDETGGAATGGDGAATVQAATRDIYVVLVAERTPERVRPLSEVRAQVEDAVLQTKRAELQDTWLTGLREKIGVENLLAAASPADSFTTAPAETGGAIPADTGGNGVIAAPADTSVDTGGAGSGGVERGGATIPTDESGGAANPTEPPTP